ncbi:MAG: hypothetical protein U0990_05235 [Candidatus Nanopelagicales bacterium]|nr:hypothetical protein [Candidatus Nanopelagicales bacterium]MDZ4249478.1 hypothetical protein [Candidatus Nanopelagicales bacterium]
MREKLSPTQMGIITGLVAGFVVAVGAWTSGAYRTGSIIPAILDASFAFMFAAALFGGVAAFIQWRRLEAGKQPPAPSGWYDSPREDGTEWYWSGTEWTGQSRPAAKRTRVL